MPTHLRFAALVLTILCTTTNLLAADPLDTQRGNEMLATYFRSETAKLADDSLTEIKTLDDWTSQRGEYRRQLFEMLGLDPLPARTDLKAVVTGRVDHEEFTIENVQFQSRPGLYVTGNLYLPKNAKGPVPTILYVCGHGNVKKDGVSYGAKAAYQHHGAWFARHGFGCLTIDTLQLGEIEGLHHGVYREKMWWWNCRGYTPAGVEAWNCIRALDYLQSRPEVDGECLGVTGRSGGGAYSWWIAALDDRIQAAVPVAGITDLQNHVVDPGCVEGHCDCMFMVNTYRWDYAKVAALVAPRPLLIANTDRDSIFPLEGVVRVHQQVRRIYRLFGADEKLGLQISEGPHKDTQELQVAAFHWFNRHLMKKEPLIEAAATKLFQPEQLQVFKGANLPEDQLNTKIHETFTALAVSPELTSSSDEWTRQRDRWMNELREKSFRGWPQETGPLDLKEVFSVERAGVRLRAIDFTSQTDVRLRLFLAERAGLTKPDLVVLNALDDQGWNDWLAMLAGTFAEELKEEPLPDADENAFKSLQGMFKAFPWTMAYVAPRGVGPTAFNQSDKKQIQNRRRFMLLGQTLDGMQVWDIRRAIQAIRGQESEALRTAPLWLNGERQMGGNMLYASLFEPNIKRIDLHKLPTSHRDGPYYLNVMKYLDMPQAVAMAASQSQVRVYQSDAEGKASTAGWEYPAGMAQKLGWDAKQLQFRPAMKSK